MPDKGALVIHSVPCPDRSPPGTVWMDWRVYRQDGFRCLSSTRFDCIVVLPLAYDLGREFPGSLPHIHDITDRLEMGGRAVFCVPAPPLPSQDELLTSFALTRGVIAEALPVYVESCPHPEPGDLALTYAVGPWAEFLRAHPPTREIKARGKRGSWSPLAYASENKDFAAFAVVVRVGDGFAVVVPETNQGENVAAIIDAVRQTKAPPKVRAQRRESGVAPRRDATFRLGVAVARARGDSWATIASERDVSPQAAAKWKKWPEVQKAELLRREPGKTERLGAADGAVGDEAEEDE